MTVDDSHEASFTVVKEDKQGPCFGARQKNWLIKRQYSNNLAFVNSCHSGQLEESPGTGKTGRESQILCSETNVKTEKL